MSSGLHKTLYQDHRKGYAEDQYVLQNLKWSRVYLMSTLSNDILQKVLTLLMIKLTGPEFYVSTAITILSYYYDAFDENLNHLESLNFNIHMEENVTDYCNKILVDDELLESSVPFNTYRLGCITRIFEYTSHSRFHIWVIQRYKKVE